MFVEELLGDSQSGEVCIINALFTDKGSETQRVK